MKGRSMDIDKVVAAGIRVVVLDVDGVLTDGGIYVGATEAGEPVELKRFHVEDGLGVKMLQKAGIHVAIVSGRVSAATARRASELGVEDVHQDGGAKKLPIVRDLMTTRGVDWPHVAIIGDDLADLPVLRKAGLPATVANGVAEVRKAATWQSTRRGGEGAVREFAEALLSARGEWDGLVDRYCRDRSG
ncbi:MAG: KdsC family phosphatase [Longimicrobiales bacterium]